MIMSFKEAIEDLGLSGRFIKTSSPECFGCLCGGDGKNWFISEPQLMTWNDEKGAWVSDDKIFWVTPDGVGHTTHNQPNLRCAVYSSPNKSDVTLFISGFVTAVHLVINPPNQESTVG